MNIYLDSASTTSITPQVLDAMMPYLTIHYGNPSSHHFLGQESRRAIENARKIIADSIGAKPSEIYFTSGGSEANNLAIKCMTLDHRGSWVTSKIEHHSIHNACKQLKQQFNIDTLYANNDKNGIVTPDDIYNAQRWDTQYCSIMMVNNEIGTIEPIKEIGEYCWEYNILFHTDAVQAFGHIPIDVTELKCDLLSVSGHKIHAPKGIGFVFIREGIEQLADPLIAGGQQERGLRAGTENVAAIVGLGEATRIAMESMESNYTHEKKLCLRLLEGLSTIAECHVNNDISVTDYRHVNFRIDGIDAAVMLSAFDAVGVCLSSGSACNSDSTEPSHVLKAIGLSDEEANSSLRVSLGEGLTKRDIDLFISLLKSNIQMIKGVAA